MQNKITVFIFHGSYGYPGENWFGWMKQELEALGIACQVPQFPTPEGQSLQAWLEVLQGAAFQPDETTILIGHSLGAAFLLRYLETTPLRFKAALLVGAFLGEVGLERFDRLNRDFFLDPFDWMALRKTGTPFFCYQGSDDPYISYAQFAFLADQLEAQKILVSKAGHFNAAAGYRQFPQLLLHLKQIMERT
jgi:hypothetical protein